MLQAKNLKTAVELYKIFIIIPRLININAAAEIKNFLDFIS